MACFLCRLVQAYKVRSKHEPLSLPCKPRVPASVSASPLCCLMPHPEAHFTSGHSQLLPSFLKRCLDSILWTILSFHPPDGIDVNTDKSSPFISLYRKKCHKSKYVMFMRQLCFNNPLNCLSKSFFNQTRDTAAISIKSTPCRNRHYICKQSRVWPDEVTWVIGKNGTP